MDIRYYGHSCFLLTTKEGIRVLIDPCSPKTGYALKDIEADVVTISHDHHDHNYLAAVKGQPVVVRKPGVHKVAGIRITGIKSYHDEERGALRGSNLIFLYEINGMRVAHLGDLGAYPSEEAMRALGKLHVLFAPIGGTYTITPPTACKIANATKTNVLIPMHYQTLRLAFDRPLLEVEQLLSIAKDCTVHKLNQDECTITNENLGADRILVLQPREHGQDE